MDHPTAPDAHTKKPKDIKFLSMPPLRLFMLSTVTLGFYQLYWFFKNWKAIKIAEQRKLSPFWRTIFTIFYIWPLFKKMRASAKQQGYDGAFPVIGWSILYLGLAVAGSILSYLNGYVERNALYAIGFILLAVATVVPLLLVQKAVNTNNKNIEEKPARTSGETTIVVVGVILALCTILALFVPMKTPTTPNTLSPQAQAEKAKMDSLTAQYETCSNDLLAREASVDETDALAVEEYNTDVDACEDIRVKQNESVEKYNQLLGL